MDIRALIRDEQIRAEAKRKADTKSPTDKSPTEYRIAQTLDMLDQYVGSDTPVDALQTMTPRWLDAFEQFMIQGSPGLSPATAHERRARLVSCIRGTIKRRLLPNIAIDANAQPHAQEIRSIATIDRKRDIETLLSLYYYKKERLEHATHTRREAAALRLDTQALAYAILATMLVGIGYDGLARLRRTDLDGNHLRLSHLDITIEITPQLLAIIHWLAPADSDTPLLLFAADPDVESLSQRVASVVARCSLVHPDGFADPMTQWLEIALGHSTSPLTIADARDIIDRMYGTDRQTDIAATVQTASDNVARAIRHLGYEWYCIRCIGDMTGNLNALQPRPTAGKPRKDTRTRGEIMLALLQATHKFNLITHFAPNDTRIRERNGRKEIRPDRFIGSLLFIKANYMQIEAVNRYLMSVRGGFIYSIIDDERMHYCPISEGEIEILRSFFDARRARRLDAKSPDQITGLRAKIITGLYDGYEGRIVRVVYDRDRNIRRVIVNLQGESLTAEYHADPDYLEIVDP